MDILIQQGVADPENELYTSMYLPYYNRSVWIQDELREREAEVLKLRGTRSNPDGVLDYIEKQRQAIANKLDLRTYLGESLWVEFCSFRRDDTYQNDNFISDGLSDTELITQAKEFVKNAEREIIKSATLQHTISCNLKSVNIGDQCSQIIGIYYPTQIDNFVKIVEGQKFYGRYMDDSYVISQSREYLVELEAKIAAKATELGMTLNRKKTRIVKLSDYYRFLQISYSLTDTGRVIRKINPKRIVDMRRKLKALSIKVKNGERTQEEVENMFRSWMGGHCHLMSKIQRDNLNLLYYDLFGGFIDGKYYLQYYPRKRNRDSRHDQWQQLYHRRCS